MFLNGIDSDVSCRRGVELRYKAALRSSSVPKDGDDWCMRARSAGSSTPMKDATLNEQ